MVKLVAFTQLQIAVYHTNLALAFRSAELQLISFRQLRATVYDRDLRSIVCILVTIVTDD